MQSISEKIKQRRRQILVHSYIYYELNQNIIDDITWSKWAKDLELLQIENPKESGETEYANDFKDWDGSSGAFLNFDDNIKHIANHLLKIRKE